MRLPKLTKLELQIMDIPWTHGPCAIREIQEFFPKRYRPPYTTIQMWQSTLFAGAAALLALALRGIGEVRYWVWLTASAKFLIPFSLLVWLGTLAPHRAAASGLGGRQPKSSFGL